MALNFFNKIFRDRLLDDIIDDSANPWPGLSPYADPKDSKHAKQFCGRDSESYDVTQLITNNIFVTLYGKSGNGKTSLLNAGVSPKLREARFVPISIRLGLANENVSFQQHIISEIEKPELDLRTKEINVVDKIEDNTTVDYLWSYFARHKFYNADNKIVFPVIILDQFEEVFRVRQEDTATLLKQISFLMDEGHALTDRTIDGNKYEYSFNFRFVVSIREDDLYKLEDTIDNNYLGAMKQNRYRLRPITKDGAKDIITIPGKDIFDEADTDKIVETIVDIATGKDNFISANILSLLCSQIYIEKYKGKITKRIDHEFVEKIVSNRPLEQFYLDATKDLSSKEKAYLEDNLVDVSGRRSSVPKANYDKTIRMGEKLLIGATKILQESNGRIELIHDSFCPVIEEQIEKRQGRWIAFIDHIMLFIITAISIWTMMHCYNLIHNNLRIELPKAIILIFITIGIVHKSLKIIPAILGLACIAYSYYYSSYISIFTLIIILLGVYVIVGWFYTRINRQEKQTPFSLSDYLKLPQFHIWTAITLLAYLYLEDSDIQSNIIILLCTIWCLLSIFNDYEISLFLTMFISFPFITSTLYSSDLVVFHFYNIDELFTAALVIPLAVLISLSYHTYKAKQSIAKAISLPIVGWCFLFFVPYFFLYKYKLWFMIIGFVWIFLYFVQDHARTKILKGIFFIIISIAICIAFLGYNTSAIKGINPFVQVGKWRWNTVVRESNGKYEVLNAKTGDQIIDPKFDRIEKKSQGNCLSASSKYKFKSCYAEFLGHYDTTLYYMYSPEFEYNINEEKNNNNLWASTYCKYRDFIINRLIDGQQIQVKQYPKCIDSLIEQYITELKNMSDMLKTYDPYEDASVYDPYEDAPVYEPYEDSSEYNPYEDSLTYIATDENSLENAHIQIYSDNEHKYTKEYTTTLYKALATSLLKNVSIDIDTTAHDKMHQLVTVFNEYAIVHTLDYVDCDDAFEKTAKMFLLCKTDSLQDNFIPTVLPELIDLYRKNVDVNLYAKIYLLNKIAIKYHLPNYIDSLKVKNPFKD